GASITLEYTSPIEPTVPAHRTALIICPARPLAATRLGGPPPQGVPGLHRRPGGLSTDPAAHARRWAAAAAAGVPGAWPRGTPAPSRRPPCASRNPRSVVAVRPWPGVVRRPDRRA